MNHSEAMAAHYRRLGQKHKADDIKAFMRQVSELGQTAGALEHRQDLRHILLQQMRELYEVSGELVLIQLEPFGGDNEH